LEEVIHGALCRWICADRSEAKARCVSTDIAEGRKDLGTVEYIEAVGDDLNVKWGRPFPRLVKPRAGEVIVFSWIVYKSKGHRDRVNRQVMKDPRMADSMDPKKMPFDMKRMAYGGFKVLVDM